MIISGNCRLWNVSSVLQGVEIACWDYTNGPLHKSTRVTAKHTTPALLRYSIPAVYGAWKATCAQYSSSCCETCPSFRRQWHSLLDRHGPKPHLQSQERPDMEGTHYYHWHQQGRGHRCGLDCWSERSDVIHCALWNNVYQNGDKISEWVLSTVWKEFVLDCLNIVGLYYCW